MRTIHANDVTDHDTIGQHFKAHDGKYYWCDSWVENMGFWMTEVDKDTQRIVPEGRRTNVSERAIGRTFHRTYYGF